MAADIDERARPGPESAPLGTATTGPRLYLLGAPRLETGGVEVPLRRRRAMALLAFLAMDGERHAREQVATLLWPDSDRAHALGGLRRHLSELNTVLGDGVIHADRRTVGLLSAGLWVDARRFCELLVDARDEASPAGAEARLARLREAADLYADDFLSGFGLPDSAAFDEWQSYQADGLRRQLALCLDLLVDAHRTAHDAAGAIRTPGVAWPWIPCMRRLTGS